MKIGVWDTEEKAGEVGKCIKCNRKIWIFWKIRKKPWIQGYEKMDKCANCYFGRK